MGGLGLTTTECGVLIGFMLSALRDASRVFEAVNENPTTSSDVRNEITGFGNAMQALARYMEAMTTTPTAQDSVLRTIANPVEDHVKVEPDVKVEARGISDAGVSSDSSAGAPLQGFNYQHIKLEKNAKDLHEERTVQMRVYSEDPAHTALRGMSMDELRHRLVEDFQNQGIRVPLQSCWVDSGCHHVFLLTSSKYNAAILKDPTFWKPRLFGNNAHVVELDTRTDDPDWEAKPSSTQDRYKIQQAKEKAKRNARIFWIDITDRIFAKEHFSAMDNTQLAALIRQDMATQYIDIPFERCKKSSGCSHIRVWASHTNDVKPLVQQWKPTLFGTGAFLRWRKRRDLPDNPVSSNPDPQQQQRIKDSEDEDERTPHHYPQGIKLKNSETDDEEEEPPTTTTIGTSKSARRARQIPREIFITIPDHRVLDAKYLNLKPAQLKNLVREDLRIQGFPVPIA
ncbi:MAG: hypothetical protein Q9168_008245, partial [Polycauliona sp. 1 TL-2023]